MEEIEKYLGTEPNVRNYIEGVSIYKKFGNSNVLKGFFKLGESTFSRQKLFNSISEIVIHNQLNVSKLGKFEAIRQKKEERQKPPSDLSDNPEIIKLIDRRKNLYMLNSNLFARLKLMVENEKKFTDEERGKISNKILKTAIEISAIWNKTNYFDLNKVLPPELEKITFESKSDIELIKKLNATRTKISQSKSGKRPNKDIADLINLRDYLETLIEEIEVDVTVKE